MKKFLTIVLAACLFLLPLETTVYPQQNAKDSPPLAQALVREGDFAVDLVQALQLGVARNESQAESTLASLGIAPKNGWIADYPMTPDISVEVQDAAGAAASSGKLATSRTEALQAVETVSANLGLPVMAAIAIDDRTQAQSMEDNRQYPVPPDYSQYSVPPDYSQYSVPPDYSQYSDPTVIDNYYYDYGPPIVTYYTPPWDYNYLYSWVPFPFWCNGSFFGGFFIQNDFDRVVKVHRHFHGNNVFVDRTMDKRVTNHITGNNAREFGRVDPVARNTGSTWRTAFGTTPTSGFNSNAAQNGAQSIFGRSMQRASPGGMRDAAVGAGANLRSTIPSNSAEPTLGQVHASTNIAPANFAGRGSSQTRSATSERSMGSVGNGAVAQPGGGNFSSINRSHGFESHAGINPAPSLHTNNRAFISPHLGSGPSVQGFRSGGGSVEAFHSGGGPFGQFHNGDGRFGAFRSGGGSFGGLHSSGGSFGAFRGSGGSFAGLHAGGFHGGGLGHGGR